MNWFEKFLLGLKGTMERPTNYGWFHLMFFAIVIASTILICIYGRNAKSKNFKIVVAVLWGGVLLLEIYKQLIFSISEVDGQAVWDYQWYAFPYQLCSTPLFLLPFVAFMKDGKIRDSIMSFLSTFAMFGGLVVFLYPNDVFVQTIGINIQTMIHHGLQIVLGIYFMVYNRKKLNWMYFVKGIIVFAVMVGIAQLLNIIVYHAVTKANGETFNMFYISPYYPCTLALLGDLIYPNVPYIVFLLIYIIGFTGAGALMFLIQYYAIKGVTMLYNKKRVAVAFQATDNSTQSTTDFKPMTENEQTNENNTTEQGQ